MSMRKGYYKHLYDLRSSFNIQNLAEMMDKSTNGLFATTTSEELRNLIDALGISYSKENSPFNALIQYFNLKLNNNMSLEVNDTELSTVIMTLLHIRQHQGELILFSSETGWNTITEQELNKLIIAISVVTLDTKPPRSSMLKQVREYLEGNAVSSDKIVTREYFQLINGCYHPESGKLVPHSDERLPMVRLNVDLSSFTVLENVEVPDVFRKFIMDSVGHDNQYFEYLLDVFASLLDLSAPISAKGVILHGSGGNGKTVLMDLLESFFLETDIAVKSLDDMGKDFGLQNLTGAMINVSHELSADKPKAESVRQLKRLLDSNPGSTEVNEKFKKPKNRVIDLKMIFSSNTVVDFGKGQREPLSRRIIVLPFNNTPENKDLDITDKLVQQKEEIIAYLLKRIHNIHLRRGFTEAPELVTQTNNLWFSENNYFANNPQVASEVLKWLNLHTEHHRGNRVNRADLNRKIKAAIPEVTSNTCNQIIESELHFKPVKSKGEWEWVDMQLKSPIDNEKHHTNEKHHKGLSKEEYFISDEYY